MLIFKHFCKKQKKTNEEKYCRLRTRRALKLMLFKDTPSRARRALLLLPLSPFTLAKTKIQKTWVFCCTVYTARKTHNIRGFWHEKRMREKTPNLILMFW